MAKTVNEEIVDKLILRSILTQQFTNAEVRKIIKLFNDAVPELVQLLASRLAHIESGSRRLSTENAKKLSQLIQSLNDVLDGASAGIFNTLTDSLTSFGAQESAYTVGVIRTALPIQVELDGISPDLLKRIISKQPIQGQVLEKWIKSIQRTTLNKVTHQINIGLVQGEGISGIVRRVQGTPALGYSDGVIRSSKNHITAIVRTAVTEISNSVREEVGIRNDDVVKGFKFYAVLDTRTTLICMANDGKYWDIGDAKMKRPPLHWNCRSSLVPVTKSWKELKIPGLKEISHSTRASMNGQVPADLTYPEWLKKQSAETIDKALGPRRGELFRTGKYEIGDFINDQGKTLTLEQLAKISS